MKRGPKPKPPSACISCDRCSCLTRGLCQTCYVRKLRKGEIAKLPLPILPDCLSPYQIEVLNGSLLGDGCLFRHKPTHKPYYCVQRCLRDKAYSDWHYEIFQDFTTRYYIGQTFDHRTQKTYEWAKLTTRRSNVWSEHYEKWYSSTKIVPQNVFFTPLTLAVWLADDGCVRPIGSPHRLQLKLSTHGFPIDSVEYLCSMLCDRYGEYFGITLDGSQGVIYAQDNACRKFLLEIDSVFPESMLRKACWRNTEACFYDKIPLPSKPMIGKRKSKNGKRAKVPLSQNATPSI